MAMTSLRRPHPLKLALLGASVRYSMVTLINYLLTKSLKDWAHRILTKNIILPPSMAMHSPVGLSIHVRSKVLWISPLRLSQVV